MKSVKISKQFELVINKSKFISILFYVQSEYEIKSILKSIKKKYYDSSHICYAYIIGNIKRFSDDAEPSGTAGIPILSCLENNNLNYILCVVIRYFGGIKLGAGGLVRAYSKSCSSVIKNSDISELIDGFEVEITFPYSNLKNIDNLLSKYNVLNKLFDQDIKYIFNISKIDYNKLNLELNKLGNIKIKSTLFFN